VRVKEIPTKFAGSARGKKFGIGKGEGERLPRLFPRLSSKNDTDECRTGTPERPHSEKKMTPAL